MKSLVLKDLFNIGHNAKSMLLMLLVFAFILIPLSGPEAYMVTSSILCSMMIITTFSFDDSSKWMKYAVVTPVTKKNVVTAKFIVLLIFSAIGAVIGLLIGAAGGIITHKLNLGDLSGIVTLPAVSFVGFLIAEVFGSISIPLLFKFGAEKARTLTLVAFVVPLAICFGIYELLSLLGVTFTDNTIFTLLCFSPLIAFAWNLLMYKISYTIFAKKELLY